MGHQAARWAVLGLALALGGCGPLGLAGDAVVGAAGATAGAADLVI